MAGELAPQQQEFVETITHSINRIISIINDLSDISEIEDGTVAAQSARGRFQRNTGRGR